MAEALGSLGAWVRLHYVYPYPHVDQVLPLMAEGKVLPYLDIPFQHASPTVLKAMRRPAHQEKTLDRISSWRDDLSGSCHPLDLHRRLPRRDRAKTSSFSSIGSRKRGSLASAASNMRTSTAPRPMRFPARCPQEVKEERYARLMQHQQAISAEVLAERVGKTIEIIVDEVDGEGAIARSHLGRA